MYGWRLERGQIVVRYDRLRAHLRESLRQAQHLFDSLLEWAFGAVSESIYDTLKDATTLPPAC